MKMPKLRLLLPAAIALILVPAGHAGIIVSGSPASNGYDAALTVDGSFWTDYASAGLGALTHLDFDLGGPVTVSSIQFTDRTSSGGDNGSQAMGTSDFVTEFQYIFYADPAFTSSITYLDVSHGTPGCLPCTPADLSSFQVTTTVEPPVTARYVRWQVVSSNGVNPGAADISFTIVPEPGSFAAGAVGILILALRWRRR
jgi:hypothetical protein